VTNRKVDIERELATLSDGNLSADQMIEASGRLMTEARGSQWCHGAAFRGRALLILGRMAEGFATLEEAWQRADRLDDPVACALASRIGAGRSLMLYANAEAERWCRRELNRHRSRLVPNWRSMLVDHLANALVSQGDLPGARECLSEFEGAASRHSMLAYCEGDWDRSMMFFQRELDRARSAGQPFAAAHAGSVLGRLARVANRRVEAEAILDDALQAALACGDLNRELFIRIELALISSDFGQVPRAKTELRRCKEILDNGEDWVGHLGAYLHTSALVKAAEDLLRVQTSAGRWHFPPERGVGHVAEEVTAGFRKAIEIFRACRSPWEETATLGYWAQVLFASTRLREALQTLDAAFKIFDRIGTPKWSEQMQIAVYRFYALSNLSAPITVGDAAAANVFRKEGDYWTVSFHGSMFRLHDTIGMHYIRRLLAAPGVDFAAQNLVDITQKANTKRPRKKPARANGRANAARPDGSEYLSRERARLMVTKRIKDVIARIRPAHSELARHLATCIRTGHTCSYVAYDEHSSEWLT
jgi:tetratricopeptide (TPR) repeat protein